MSPEGSVASTTTTPTARGPIQDDWLNVNSIFVSIDFETLCKAKIMETSNGSRFWYVSETESDVAVLDMQAVIHGRHNCEDTMWVHRPHDTATFDQDRDTTSRRAATSLY